VAGGGAGLGKRRERGGEGEGERSGGEGKGGPQVTVEPRPLRALLYATAISSIIVTCPVTMTLRE